MSRHLLISARDPGAATHLSRVAARAAADPDWRVSVIAAAPADRIFADRHIPHRVLRQQGPALEQALQALLEELQPDAILAGLSGPDRGLDETLMALAGAIPCYLFQDYWGDLNAATPEAVRILSLDDEGVTQTRARHARPARAVGSPAHDGLPSPLLGRARLRRRYRLGRRTKITGLCDQPLWSVRGYGQALRRAVAQLRQGCLLIRPHPRTGWRQRLRLRRLARATRVRVIWDDSSLITDFVPACDLLLSAFSNCAYDAANSNARAGHGAGTVALNLLCEPDLYRHYVETSGFAATPLDRQGLARDVIRRGRLPMAIRSALRPASRRRVRQAARRRLPRTTASEALLKLIGTDLGG